MTPKLAELIAYCREQGIEGRYGVRFEEGRWRARINVGMVIHSGPADTRDAALERIAEAALRDLRDPMPQPGTDAYAAWRARRTV